MSAKLSHLAVAGIVAPILRTLQAGERIVRRNEAGELVTLDLAEIAKRVGAATGHTIAVARKRPVKVVGADGKVVKELTADEFLAQMLSRHFGVEVAPPKANAKPTLFWCACGVTEPIRYRICNKKRCSACKLTHKKEVKRAAYHTDPRVLEYSKRSRAKHGKKWQANRLAAVNADRASYRSALRARYAKDRERVLAKQKAAYEANIDAMRAKRQERRDATRERVNALARAAYRRRVETKVAPKK